MKHRNAAELVSVWWFLVAAATSIAPFTAARAQFAGAAYGAYNVPPLNLSPGAFAPLQLDSAGNVRIDCVLGCAAGASGGQGATASAANAWPIYAVQSGAAVSNANPLSVLDQADGNAITGALLPAGGTGIIGWLSAMYRAQTGTLSVGGTVSVAGNVAVTDATVATALAGTLKVVASGITGAPTVAAGSMTASTAILPAEPGAVSRLHLAIVNFAGAGGANLYCTDDGSTPSATSASFIVYAQGFYERDTPAWVPSAAITCVPATGAVAYRVESYP
jgi:hypothetical protein